MGDESAPTWESVTAAAMRKAAAEMAAESNKRVQKTADGDTANKVTVGLGLTVILDQPAKTDDTFELVSSNGKSTVLVASAAEDLVKGEKVLRFEGIKPDMSYKLFHIPKGQMKRVIFNITQQEKHVVWKPFSQMFTPNQELHFSKYYLFYPRPSVGQNPKDKDLIVHLSALTYEDPRI